MKRVISGFVTVRGFPSSSCWQNSGMTDPREAMTFPYRVRHSTGSPGSICRERAITFFSMMALVMPIALMGYAALSVERKMAFCTWFATHAEITLSEPTTFVLTASMG